MDELYNVVRYVSRPTIETLGASAPPAMTFNVFLILKREESGRPVGTRHKLRLKCGRPGERI
jgi:hypothetical protein